MGLKHFWSENQTLLNKTSGKGGTVCDWRHNHDEIMIHMTLSWYLICIMIMNHVVLVSKSAKMLLWTVYVVCLWFVVIYIYSLITTHHDTVYGLFFIFDYLWFFVVRFVDNQCVVEWFERNWCGVQCVIDLKVSKLFVWFSVGHTHSLAVWQYVCWRACRHINRVFHSVRWHCPLEIWC